MPEADNTHLLHLPRDLPCNVLWPGLRCVGCSVPRFRLTDQCRDNTWLCLSARCSLTETHSIRTKPTLLVSVSSSWNQCAHSRESNTGHGCDSASCPHHPAKHTDSGHCSACGAHLRAHTRVVQALKCLPQMKDKTQKDSVSLLLNWNVRTTVLIQSRTTRAVVSEIPGPAGWCFYFQWTA